MAWLRGYGWPGPAIHGRAFGRPRGSAERGTGCSSPSMAWLHGYGWPGPAIHGRAFGRPRGSA
ncbi:MAG TPA: hypothetical protein VIG54_09740, partial [Lysobacter sp.]